jgi:hypothetical protein
VAITNQGITDMAITDRDIPDTAHTYRVITDMAITNRVIPDVAITNRVIPDMDITNGVIPDGAIPGDTCRRSQVSPSASPGVRPRAHILQCEVALNAPRSPVGTGSTPRFTRCFDRCKAAALDQCETAFEPPFYRCSVAV